MGEHSIESRLSALESQIVGLKLPLLSNESFFPHKNENQWARPDSNLRPPPFEGSFSKLEPLLSLFTTDCQLVKEVQSRDDEESKGDVCTSSEEDRGASHRQTDSKNGLFLELTTEHPQGRVQEVAEGGLLSLKLQFGQDELLSYSEYRKTELTRKSADWINRARPRSGSLHLELSAQIL